MFEKASNNDPEAAGKRRWLLILAVAGIGILLLLLGGGGLLEDDGEEKEQEDRLSEQEEFEEYRQQLEARVKALCESVGGISQVTVAISLDGSFEEVYATEQRENGERYVIVGSGSNASALHLTRLSPQISGIGVVCRGGGNADVRQELTSLLSAAFSVPSNRIYIAEAVGST